MPKRLSLILPNWRLKQDPASSIPAIWVVFYTFVLNPQKGIKASGWSNHSKSQTALGSHLWFISTVILGKLGNVFGTQAVLWGLSAPVHVTARCLPKGPLTYQQHGDGSLGWSGYNQGRIWQLPYLWNELSALGKKGEGSHFGLARFLEALKIWGCSDLDFRMDRFSVDKDREVKTKEMIQVKETVWEEQPRGEKPMVFSWSGRRA